MASSEDHGFGRLRNFFRTNSTKLTEDNQRLQQLNEHMEIVIQSQRQVMDSLRTAIRSSKEESLREENRSKDTEIQRLKEENKKKDTEIQRLQAKNSDMERNIQRLEEENNKKKKTIEHLQEEKDNTMRGSVTVLNEELGRGAFGAVYTGDFYGTKVAVKEYHEIIMCDYYMRILEREINIASQCRHPNLLQFLCAAQNKDQHLLIVTELMDISLRTLITQRVSARSKLVPQEIKLISLNVAYGLNYLHSKKPNPIIHRDISSANVLLSVDNNTIRRAKVSDYGSANLMQLCKTPNPGAVLYAAPEAADVKHDPKIDVYSYGMLVCEMSICMLPDPDERKNQIKRISNGSIKRLVKRCTKTGPQKRPTMQDVIELWNKI